MPWPVVALSEVIKLAISDEFCYITNKKNITGRLDIFIGSYDIFCLIYLLYL